MVLIFVAKIPIDNNQITNNIQLSNLKISNIYLL